MEIENVSRSYSAGSVIDVGDGALERNDVYLTWSDLCVTVPDKKAGGRRSILDGLTGYAAPGQALAIMGPSGCGKSTLLDTLAGIYIHNCTP